jgi:hypothetical protein
MSNLSRRSLVASAAALPALAVPVVAIASVESDPIYAAIKAVVEAERADAEAIEQLEAAKERFKDEYGSDEPDAFCREFRELLRKEGSEELERFSRAECNSHETIDNLANVLVTEGTQDREGIRAYLHKELDQQTAAYNETVKPLDDAHDAAWERFTGVAEEFLDTRPTTLAGLAAML